MRASVSAGVVGLGLGAASLAVVTLVAAAESPVADAAMRRDVQAVRALLDGGADVNAARGDGMTGLHWAATHGDPELTTLLIDAGAGVRERTRIGEHTPLHVASTMGHAEVIRILVEAGSEVGARTSTGATPLHFAAASGSREAVEMLLSRGADPDAREPEWGQTALLFAAAAGRAEVITALLAGGADPGLTAKVIDISARSEVDQEDRRRRREQMEALQERRTRGQRGAPTEQVPTPASDARPARSEASRGASALEVDLQEEPEPLGFPDLVGSYGGLTALLLATREGHREATFALLDGGADINQVSAADRTSPLLMAAINGHFDLAMLLLERGADPTLASAAGATPLYATLNMQWAPDARHPQPRDHLRQEVSYLELMQALIDAGAPVNVRLTKSLWFTTYNRDLLGVDRAGATPFWRAAYALDLEAMRLLLAHGADPTIPTLKTPQRRRRGDDTDHSGLPPIRVGGPGVYPIHAASGVGYGQGFAGNTHQHVPDGWLPAVELLVEELDADVNARDHNGYTPVHHAASRGDNDLILYLVAHGADVTAVSRRGQTTADMANGPVQRVQPFPETVALLESLGATNNHNCVSC